MPEHQNIEYKLNWPDDPLKWVCGFGNAAVGINTNCNGIRKGGQMGGQAGGRGGQI